MEYYKNFGEFLNESKQIDDTKKEQLIDQIDSKVDFNDEDSFNKSTLTFKASVEDWIVIFNSYDQGHGQEVSKSDQQAQIDELYDELYGTNKSKIKKLTSIYKSALGQNGYDFEYEETIKGKKDVKMSGGSRGYLLNITYTIKPK